MLGAHPLQQRRIARTPSPEAEVAPDEDRGRVQRIDEDVADEVLGGQRGERAIEGEHQRRVEVKLAEQLDLALGRDDVLGAQLGPEHFERVAVEGDRHGSCADRPGVLAHPLDHGAVPDVNTVELADRDDGAAEVGRHLGRVAEDDHADSPWGRWVRSHHRPNTGSTSGMKR